MFGNEEIEDVKPKKVSKGLKSIKPKRDFHIKCNEHDIKICKGESIEVPDLFLENLKTEGVI
jgi:hypothetical protein